VVPPAAAASLPVARLPPTALPKKSRLGSAVPTGYWDRIAWWRLVEFPSPFLKTERSAKKKGKTKGRAIPGPARTRVLGGKPALVTERPTGPPG